MKEKRETTTDAPTRRKHLDEIKMKGNIKCECYWNNEGFEVARKYLYKKNIYGEKFDRIPLNDLIRENLEWIGEKYDGVESTMEVLELIDSYYSYPEEY